MKPKWNASEKFIDLSKNRFQVRMYIHVCMAIWGRERERELCASMRKQKWKKRQTMSESGRKACEIQRWTLPTHGYTSCESVHETIEITNWVNSLFISFNAWTKHLTKEKQMKYWRKNK